MNQSKISMFMLVATPSLCAAVGGLAYIANVACEDFEFLVSFLSCGIQSNGDFVTIQLYFVTVVHYVCHKV